jgi:hypothetical protein
MSLLATLSDEHQSCLVALAAKRESINSAMIELDTAIEQKVSKIQAEMRQQAEPELARLLTELTDEEAKVNEACRAHNEQKIVVDCLGQTAGSRKQVTAPSLSIPRSRRCHDLAWDGALSAAVWSTSTGL